MYKKSSMTSRTFSTNVEVIDDILDKGYIQDGMTVLEPAAGSGAIVARIRERFDAHVTGVEIDPELAVQTSGVVNGDVFQVEANGKLNRYDAIITNPPYENFEKFVELGRRRLKPGGKVIMLLRVTLLAGVARYKWIQQYTPQCIWLLSRRPKFNGAERVDTCAYAWVIWGEDNDTPCEFKWVSPNGRTG